MCFSRQTLACLWGHAYGCLFGVGRGLCYGRVPGRLSLGVRSHAGLAVFGPLGVFLALRGSLSCLLCCGSAVVCVMFSTAHCVLGGLAIPPAVSEKDKQNYIHRLP